MPALTIRSALLPALALSIALSGVAFLGGPLGGAARAQSPGQLQAAGFGGDADRGAALITGYGCGACHVVPGVPGADGVVGPPLTMIARRIYLAGVLRNTPENMVFWLRYPQRVVPGNAMPDMGVTSSDARDIAAYLYTLR
ncbi:MAG TPA: cytochrome C [Dongiaceae bacterium]|nr:cytochrome C [Dongiaceae bacterium]